jgi:hypothetical protein
MDTTLLIGTWKVTSYYVRGEKSETPDGWAEFSFFDDGTVVYTNTRQGRTVEDGVRRRWWADSKGTAIYQNGMLAWHVKYLSAGLLILSQTDSAAVYTCTKKAMSGE